MKRRLYFCRKFFLTKNPQYTNIIIKMRKTLLFLLCFSGLSMFMAQAETVTFDLSRAGTQSLEYSQPVINGYNTIVYRNGAINLSVVGFLQKENYVVCTGPQLDVSFNQDSRFSAIAISHVKVDFALGKHIETHQTVGAYTLEYDDINADSFRLSMNGEEAHVKAVTVTFDPVVTIGGTGYATLYLNDAANIPDNVHVYTAELSDDKALLHPVEGTVIPARTGVILQGQGDFTFTHASEAGVPVSVNALVGSNTKMYAESYPGTLYALGIKNEVLGFYRLSLDTNTGQTPITSYKSYLLVDVGSSKPSAITFTDEVLGILSVSSQEANSQTYDLQGRLLQAKPQSVSLQKGNVVIR